MGNILRAQRKLLTGNTGTAPAQQAEVSVTDRSFWEHFLTIVQYRWWPWGIGSIIIVVVVTASFAITTPPLYKARGQMFLVQSITGSSGMDQLFSWKVYFSNIALARLGSLQNTGIRAETRLKSWLDGTQPPPEDFPELTPALKEKLAKITAPELLSSVSITPDNENVAVEVSAWGDDRAFIRYTTQAVLEGLIDTLVEHELASVNTGELQRIIDETQKDLQVVEQKIAASYTKDISEGLIPRDIRETLDRIDELNRSIEEAKLELIEVGQRISTYQSILSTPSRLTGEATVPLTLADELLRKELLLDEYKRKYTDENPKMKKLNREIESLRATIDSVKQNPERYGVAEAKAEASWQGQNIAIAVATEQAHRAALIARMANLQEQLAKTQSQTVTEDSGNKAIEIRKLDRQRDALRSFLEELNRRVEQSRRVQEGLEKRDPTFTKVEEIPVTISDAKAPGLIAYITLAIIVGLIAAIAVMYWVENMDPTVHSSEGAETSARSRILGEIPFFNVDPFIFPENPATHTANVFSLLRNHLRYSDTNHPEKAIVVTSPRPDDGKSFVAVNLAISFAQEGNRTILVDCDLRHPHKEVYKEALLLQSQPQSGLLAILENPEIPLENAVTATEAPELVVLEAGGVANNPPRLLRSEAFTNLLKKLQEQFDVVILDTPPVIPVVDASVIAELARGVLLVARWRVTRSRELSSAAERIRHVRGKVLGIALNWSPRSEPDYYYYHHDEAAAPKAAGG
jgi:capsular exopolysaccharide synthesis family protein